jgi:hypothetical protein
MRAGAYDAAAPVTQMSDTDMQRIDQTYSQPYDARLCRRKSVMVRDPDSAHDKRIEM